MTVSTSLFAKLKPFLPASFCETDEPLDSLQRQHLKQWLQQFPKEDIPLALRLLEQLTPITHTKLLYALQELHQRLLAQQSDESPIDFTTLFNASSSDVMAYHYRKTNSIPKSSFYSQHQLFHQGGYDKSKRVLVIIDDYAGTGGQFLCEACAFAPSLPNNPNQHLLELIRQYKTTYFMTVVANRNAIQKFTRLSQGDNRFIVDGFKQEFGEMLQAPQIRQLENTLPVLHTKNITLLYHHIEEPLFSEQNTRLSNVDKQQLIDFINRYSHYQYPFGVGNLQGHTLFEHHIPNSLPDLLWNPKNDTDWKPLFQRTDDISTYECSQNPSTKKDLSE